MTATLDGTRTGERAPLAVQSFSTISNVLEIPSLIKLQLDSFDWFKREGLRELLNELSPIQDFTSTKMDLIFGEYEFREPKHSQEECRERDMTFSAPLFVDVELRIKDSGEIKEQRLFFGDFPLMTDRGTFIINGAERVVVSQLVRSPGVYYTVETDAQSGQRLANAKLIPSRGAWLEFETSAKRILSVKIDRKRKLPVSVLIRTIDEPGLLPGDADNPAFAKYFAAQILQQYGNTPPAQIIAERERKRALGISITFDEAMAFAKAQYLLWPNEHNRRYLEGFIEIKLINETDDPELFEKLYRKRLIEQHGDIPEVHIVVAYELTLRTPNTIATEDEIIAAYEAKYVLWPNETVLRKLQKYRKAKAEGTPFHLIDWDSDDE